MIRKRLWYVMYSPNYCLPPSPGVAELTVGRLNGAGYLSAVGEGGSIHRSSGVFAFGPAVEARRVGMFSLIAQNYLLALSHIRSNVLWNLYFKFLRMD
jgi:hypothetical protein